MADTVNYEVDPKHELLEAENAATDKMVTESNTAYDNAIANNNATSKELQGQIDANTNDLVKAQQAQSDLAIQGIKNDMAEAEKDYLKEQSGAYVDWQKQSNRYGANAEAKAAMGMTNTGFTESSQVAMYNQYQNRVAIAREAYTRATTDFKLGIAEAKAANSVALAEIRANALAQSLEIAMQFAMQNNTLLTQKASAATSLRAQGRQNWLSVYDRLVQEAQFDKSYELDERQVALAEAQFAWQKEQANKAAKITKSGSATQQGKSGSKSTGARVSSGKKAKLDNTVKSKLANDEKKVKEKVTPINTASLNAAGYSGANAKKIDEAVRSGKLIEVEKNGQLYYYRNDLIGIVQAGGQRPRGTNPFTVFKKGR